MMTLSSACRELAKEIRQSLDAEKKGHKSMARMEITERLRSLSGQDHTRIKSQLGREMDRALMVQGLAAFPTIEETSTGDWVRIYRLGKQLSYLIEVVVNPSLEGDLVLAGIITKIKRPDRAA